MLVAHLKFVHFNYDLFVLKDFVRENNFLRVVLLAVVWAQLRTYRVFAPPGRQIGI